ncbi:MAG: chemotaxis protein CheW [Frankiaceae bacterium]
MTTALTGHVTFRIGERCYAAPLAMVREIVRLEGLAELPGMAPPLAGVIDLRGTALPVLDIRRVPDGGRPGGDVLVLEVAAGAAPLGVVVDEVRSVVGADALRPSAGPVATGLLPPYVVDVLHDGDAQVFLVDLRAMFAVPADGAGAGAAPAQT